MKVIIDIPNYEFNNDIADKFQDYFERVKADIADGTLCGNYELETTEMFLASFKRMQVLQDNATNGDVIKAMFPITKIDECNKDMYGEPHIYRVFGLDCVTDFTGDWWSAPYKKSEG